MSFMATYICFLLLLLVYFGHYITDIPLVMATAPFPPVHREYVTRYCHRASIVHMGTGVLRRDGAIVGCFPEQLKNGFEVRVACA